MRAGLLKKFIDVGFKVNIIDARFIGNTAYSFSSDTVKKWQRRYQCGLCTEGSSEAAGKLLENPVPDVQPSAIEVTARISQRLRRRTSP
jgi:hypothetical protein